MNVQKKSSDAVRIFFPEWNSDEIIQVLSKRLRALEARFPLIRVVLFGSYAKGDYTVGSAVGLLIVYQGEARADA